MSELTSWKRGRVIPNPIAIPQQRWDKTEADPDQVLFVGRNDAHKGGDIALAAFELAREKRPSLKLVCVGPGFEVKLPDEIARLRLQSSLALSTSRFENFAYAIAEALAVGMPVVASRTFAAQAMNCQTVPIDDVDATANAILANIGNAELGRRGQEWVAEHLNPLKIARETVSLYRSLMPAQAASVLETQQLPTVLEGRERPTDEPAAA